MASPKPAKKIAPRKPLTLAPGARVEIRDEEWIVHSLRPTRFGGQAVHVVGVSELVRGKEGIFLTELDTIRELRPEETSLVHDDSPRYRRSRLYLDALLRLSPATDDKLYIGHRGALRRADYQLQPAAKALRALRPRILMADGVGLGKTIEVGVLLSELIQRGRADRILVVALKSILSQFQRELWARFTIPLVRLDSVGIRRVQARIPSNMNPFYYYDKVIISIDTLKRDEKYRRYLEQSRWDVVVVDECQHVAVRGNLSQRARLAKLLGLRSDGLILTSATPHDGRSESFASLMKLLEPTAIADPEHYTSDEVKDLFLRRFKKDIVHEVQEEFAERELRLDKKKASPEEDAVFAYLTGLDFKTIARRRGGKGALFRTLLLKAFLSSPAACRSTVEHRLKHKALQDEADEEVRHDRRVLDELKARLERVTPNAFEKLKALVEHLRALGIHQKGSRERVVIFSERIDTLEFLDEFLMAELKLSSKKIEIFHGQLQDVDQAGLVERFGTADSPIRILLASDVASEGINLHYYCHRMIHFDLPWSLITLEQRNGRIDRFGQKEKPEITYLLTIPNDPKLEGDLRVLERLIEKEDAAHRNLGDVAWLMNLHGAEKEEERIARGIEEREHPETIIPDAAEPTDFMDLIFGDEEQEEPPPRLGEPVRLLSDDLAYAREAFAEALGDEGEAVEWHDHLSGFTLYPPEDLMRRFDYLPPELRNAKNALKLTVDRDRVMEALEAARQEEGKWPEWQLFWEQHPVSEWLDDRVLGKFARHEAPVLKMAHGIGPGERVFIFQGMFSNERSQPVLVDWFGVRVQDGAPSGIVSLAEIARDVGLNGMPSNPGGGLTEGESTKLTALLEPVVDIAREHMKALRNRRAEEIGGPLKENIRKLKRWRDRRVRDLDQRRDDLMNKRGRVRVDQQRILEDVREETEKLYRDRHEWVTKVLRTVPDPYLRLAAVLIPMKEQ